MRMHHSLFRQKRSDLLNLVRAIAVQGIPMLPIVAGRANAAVNQLSGCQFHIHTSYN